MIVHMWNLHLKFTHSVTTKIWSISGVVVSVPAAIIWFNVSTLPTCPLAPEKVLFLGCQEKES
jgi:hypothetical protein